MSFCVRPFRRWQHSKVLSLVALAAFVLGGIPRIGCICSDGHYELFCQRGAADAEGVGSCSCCQAAQAGCHARSCCSKEPANTDDKCPASGSIGAPCCCHPVLCAPAVAVKARQKDLGRRDLAIIYGGRAETLLPRDREAPPDSRLDQLIRPPIDLVIVLERLTI